ncbi:hypothetical protein AAG906_028975 [Vitis piasezkii]
MHQALPYRTWVPTTGGGSSAGLSSATIEPSDGPMNPGVGMKDVTCVTKMVSENAVIVFGRRGCCMCHVVMRLLLGLGVNPTVFEVDEEDEAAVVDELSRVIAGEDAKEGRPQFPAVFMGGELFGGLERVMATHISGELVPILKKAGALWL